MGREYIPTLFLFAVVATGFIWFQFFELPQIKRDREEQERKRATAAPESHSKPSE